MTSNRNKVFRDNKNGGNLINIDRSIKNIIDARPLQRLGNIKQMGVAHRVFGGATHSRLSHSIGAFGVANQIFRSLKQKSDQYVEMSMPVLGMTDADHMDFATAILLHDLGHAPYSHALESILLPPGMRNHEQCTVALLAERDDLRKQIRQARADPDAIINYLVGVHPNKALENLVSGEFDCDRVDYLVRDSESCGVKYGLYDFEWLMHSLHIIWSEGRPSLTLDVSRGFEALRVFLTARRNMHKQVYYHHTIRAIEINLRAIFRRISDIRDSVPLSASIPRLLSFLCRDGGRPSLDEFVDIDDSSVQYLIAHLAKYSDDQCLKILCEMFVNRETISCIFDSTRPFYKFYQYNRDGPLYVDDAEPQDALFNDVPRLNSLLAQLRASCESLLGRHGLPVELARYLVAHDRPPSFSARLPENFLCEIGGEIIPLADAERKFNLGASLLAAERLEIDRIYVPRMFEANLAEELYGASHD